MNVRMGVIFLPFFLAFQPQCHQLARGVFISVCYWCVDEINYMLAALAHRLNHCNPRQDV